MEVFIENRKERHYKADEGINVMSYLMTNKTEKKFELSIQ